MAETQSDWVELHNRLADGDRLAMLEVTRLVTSFLRRARAHDFESDWEDLIQQVLMATLKATREGKIKEPAALGGWIRRVTANKLNDRLAEHLQAGPGGALPWHSIHVERLLPNVEPEVTGQEADVRRALAAMKPPLGEILMNVKGHGRTCEQVSRDMGIPLGTLKRKLAEAIRLMESLYQIDAQATDA